MTVPAFGGLNLALSNVVLAVTKLGGLPDMSEGYSDLRRLPQNSRRSFHPVRVARDEV